MTARAISRFVAERQLQTSKALTLIVKKAPCWRRAPAINLCLKVCFSDEIFFLKAARDLFPGEVILSELPLVIAPKPPIGDGCVPCVGCCRFICEETIKKCPQCLWPACSSECDDLKNNLRHGLECQVLKLQPVSSNFRFDVLLPLRMFFLQTSNAAEWSNILKQTENIKKIVNSRSTEETLTFLEETYLNPLKKIEENLTIERDLLRKIFTFIKIRNVESAQIYYPTAALIEHNCTPNCLQIIEQHKITIRANSTIFKDTHITMSYTDPFQGTQERLKDLKSQNISCFCARCSDSTEVGTFFSALKCLGTKKEPCGGTQLPVEPTNPETLWVCDKCQIELPNDQMVKFLKHLGQEVVKVLGKDLSVEELEEFLAKLLMFLHPNHFHVCAVKLALVKHYGNGEESTKIDICKSLLEILRKFFPHGGPLLAEVLHELFEAQFELLRRGETPRDAVSAVLEETQTQLLIEEKIRKLVLADVDKFDAWLKQCVS